MTKITKKSSTKKKKKSPEAEGEQKKKTLFDHINEIYQYQRPDYFNTLTDSDKKSYNIYMMNRFLSMNPAQALAVNILQKYNTIDPETHYKFCINVIPKARQFNKYIKATDVKEYEPWVVERLAAHFEISKNEAIEYLDIFYSTEINKSELRKLLEMYGIEEKKLKDIRLI